MQQLFSGAALNFAHTWATIRAAGGHIQLKRNSEKCVLDLLRKLPPPEPLSRVVCELHVPFELFSLYEVVKNQAQEYDDSRMIHKILIGYHVAVVRLMTGWKIYEVHGEAAEPITIYIKTFA
jgi:hypothetical protein